MKINRLGATGRYPRGKISQDDDGEIQMAVATDHQHGIVRIEFGAPTAWLGLPSVEARTLGQMLIEKANELDQRLT